MATVLINHLRVRAGPSLNTPVVVHYDAGQVIHSVITQLKMKKQLGLYIQTHQEKLDIFV